MLCLRIDSGCLLVFFVALVSVVHLCSFLVLIMIWNSGKRKTNVNIHFLVSLNEKLIKASVCCYINVAFSDTCAWKSFFRVIQLLESLIFVRRCLLFSIVHSHDVCMNMFYVRVSIIAITQMDWQPKWIEVNANIVFSQVNADASADANTDVRSFIFPDQRWKWLDSTWNKHQLTSHRRPFDYACNHFDICIMSKTFVIGWKKCFFFSPLKWLPAYTLTRTLNIKASN